MQERPEGRNGMKEDPKPCGIFQIFFSKKKKIFKIYYIPRNFILAVHVHVHALVNG